MWVSPKDRVAEQYQATFFPFPALPSLNSSHCLCQEIKPRGLYNDRSYKEAAKGITLFTNSPWKRRAKVPSLWHSRPKNPAARDRRGPGKNVNWGHTFLFLLPQPRAVTCHPAVVLSPSSPHIHQRKRADVEFKLKGRTKAKRRIRKEVLKNSYHGNSHLEKCSKSFAERGRAGSNFSGEICLGTMVLYLQFKFSVWEIQSRQKSLCWYVLPLHISPVFSTL